MVLPFPYKYIILDYAHNEKNVHTYPVVVCLECIFVLLAPKMSRWS